MNSVEPEIIRLFDAQGSTVLDSISTEYEDSFCLESFGDLIKLAQSTDPKGKHIMDLHLGSKHFIIARVQTWDHKQPDRAFYSYYHAHHLNKLLFQTQIYLDKKLIHRLHVLNPLTNTDIIGNVLYFMVVGKSKKSGGIEVPVPPSPAVMSLSAAGDIVQVNMTLHNNSSSNNNNTDEKGKETKVQIDKSEKVGGWTLAAPISEQVDQQEFNQLSSPVEEQPKRKSFPKTEVNESAQDLVEKTTSIPAKRGVKQPALLSITTTFENSGPQSATVQRGAMTPVSINLPMSAYPSTKIDAPWLKKERPLSRVPLGIVSQYGEKVDPKDPSAIVKHSARARRRSLSYMNAIQTSGSLSATLKDWKESLKPPSPIKEGQNEEYDEVKPIIRVQSPAQEEFFYDAILLATDTDFLESSRIRAAFRENAVLHQDSVLFEMTPYTGQEPVVRNPMGDDLLLCDWCIPTAQQLRHQNRFIRWYHRYKCYVLLILLTAGILGFIWAVVSSGGKSNNGNREPEAPSNP